ncbi:MAG TPA: hypothetical protein VF812_03335 [Ktedonobacterales bacterium]
MPTTNQYTQGASSADVTSKINAYQALAHLPRTLKVAGSVMADARVKALPKILFVGSIVFILAALLTPEALAEFIAFVPGVGDILALAGLPVDATIDWLALGITALNLMKLFPQDIVNEHFDAAVAKSKPTGPVVDADPVK